MTRPISNDEFGGCCATFRRTAFHLETALLRDRQRAAGLERFLAGSPRAAP